MKYAPALFGFAALAIWEVAVRITGVPSYLVPGPIEIIAAFLADPRLLLLSLGSTLTVTFAALLVAATLGVVLAIAIASNRLLAAAIQPWAVVLQVTPIVAIAPLIIVWASQGSRQRARVSFPAACACACQSRVHSSHGLGCC